ncbi:hypothetical protein KIPB_009624, partial [Kipferlia bialata]
DGAQLLLQVSAADITPLPMGTKGMTLTQKRQYRQAMVANGLFCDLLDLVGPIIDRQTEILGYSKRLSALGSGATRPEDGDGENTDLDRWGVLDTLGAATLSLLSNLCVAQGKARTLLTQLDEEEKVTPTHVEDMEIERDILKSMLRRRTISDEKRESIRGQIAEMEEEIRDMEASVLSISEVSAQLKPYIIFPEVASALSQPLRERVVDTARDQHPCDWGEGYIVTENGLEEGVQNLFNPYAIVDKTDLDLTSDDFKEEDVTLWDLTGSRVTGVDFTAVEGLTVEKISSLSALTQCTLRGMDLTGLELSGSDATGSDFSAANLTECVVTGATLIGCDMSNCNMTGVEGLTLELVKGVKNMKGVTLTGVDMRGWDLQGVDLSGSNLSGCQMGGAKVREDLVGGATLPEGDDAPTCMPAMPRFVVARGVTETVLTQSALPDCLSGNWLPFTIIVPSVQGSRTWSVTASGNFDLLDKTQSNYVMFAGHQGEGTITRSGTSITFQGPNGPYTVSCTPGQEARVELTTHCHSWYVDSSLTLHPQ